MSDTISVKINCFFGGVFKKDDEDGKLNYVNGLLEQFEVDGDAVYDEVMKKMVKVVSKGKIWYKLPYEDISKKKDLSENGEVNKRKINANGRWYKELDVFIEEAEPDDVTATEAEQHVVDGDEIDGDTQVEQHVILGDENDAEAEQEAVDGEELDAPAEQEVEEEESEDEYQASNESENEDDFDRNFQEVLEMFRNENYEDEILDEDEIYPDTENSSDDEEEQAERMAKRGELDGVFSLRQTFHTGEDFKKQVIKYILKTRRNVVYDRWEKTKIGAKCSGKGCRWRIYCSVETPIKQWMVKVYVNTHTCHPTGKCKLIKSPAIAEVMLEKIRKEPEMSAPMIREEFRDKFNILISPEQAKIARRIVLDKLQAECNEHFARIKDYEMELLRGLRPVNGPKFWKLSGAERIEASPYKRPPGRPKGKARIKGILESPKKNPTKVSRKGRIGHCSLCGGERHNSRKCPHEPEESRAKRRRANTEQQAQEQEAEDVSSTAPRATQT
ncbi:hypothetical protein IGI04_016702 [Brassica rapa subsp. trilocularis]|uniref:Transposase MuDR plant domain-containing protein n=1 Tax=Brassica rapa subsp. trilocularis TaxID=1813537 RepID=A0ABQ7MU18_BRACM|nr:hypothetical protein IGI04_016702 [Brassica rapa subsp. trilocularis]